MGPLYTPLFFGWTISLKMFLNVYVNKNKIKWRKPSGKSLSLPQAVSDMGGWLQGGGMMRGERWKSAGAEEAQVRRFSNVVFLVRFSPSNKEGTDWRYERELSWRCYYSYLS
jgi:hypothetical protein